MNQTTLTQSNWILDTASVQQLLRDLEFRERVIDYVIEASREVTQSSELSRFLEFCNSWQERVKQQIAIPYPANWQALAVVSAFPAAIEKHRALGVPWKITQATLFDFDRRMDENSARRGAWEFNSLSWMRNHVSGKFFQIGRLQYIPGSFGYFFRIYRDSKTKTVTPLALPGLRCTPDGWPSDDATGFETSLEEREDGIVGYPASPDNGSILPTPIRIAPDSPILVDDTSTAIQIHIPWGDKLDREKCLESLKEAKAFFEKYFPEINARAFCTATWLLDPELAKVLSPTSNIVSFGKLFRPLALRTGNDRQLLERVFESDSWDNCDAQNSLQKAVLQHHRNGGQFRSGAGFILPENIN